MNELRKLLPGIQKIHYFNYAKMGPLLTPTAKKMQELVEEGRSPFELHDDQWIENLKQSRKIIAELIGASSEEIAFTESTSSGLSLIAGSIRWKEGNRILYPADEYPSNRYVWDNLEEKGVITEGITPENGVSFSHQLESMDLSNVRLIAVSAVSFWDGRRHDLERIGALCRKKKILFSVDAIQAAGVIPIDVKTWDCDFLASGGQKWLFGPIGTGFVYFRKEIIPDLYVPRIGWGSYQPLKHALTEEFEFAEGAKRFETGVGDIIGFIGLGTSIESMKEIGWKKIHSRIASLVEMTQKQLSNIDLTPIAKGPQSGIIVFEHPEAEKIHEALEAKHIYTTVRAKRIRISIHASSSEEELTLLIESLRRLL
ncbi:MAG: aminotransferase class V-fold PLP-dependent enzyme [Parachlamydiales bacterium]|nr:aminotransferase class V-fold PLP-dependent enzyme [Parachlamydiales bacterium]